MNDNQQALLVQVLDLFAVTFDQRAILRGGMVLRILGCERLTNDLDYIFVPYKSKKDIIDEIISTLEGIEKSIVDYTLNSKCLRIVVTVEETSVQIEAKVAMDVPTQILSTKELAATYGLPPRLIRVLDYPVALAHKMAAWNERRLIRDLYDIWFYLKMGIMPDLETLNARLKTCAYSKLIKKADRFPGKTIEEFYDFLSGYVNELTDKDFIDSLDDYVNQEDLCGLSMKIRAEWAKFTNQ